MWNDGASDRVVLLFDMWHPELTPDEVRAIEAMFAEVDERREARAGDPP